MRERDTCVLKRKTSAFDTFPSDHLHVNLSTDAKLQRCFPLKTTRRVKYKKTPKDEAAKAKRIPHSVLLWGTGGIFLCVFFFCRQEFLFALQKVHKQRYRSREYTGRLRTPCLIVWRVITHSYGWFFFSQISVKDKQPAFWLRPLNTSNHRITLKFASISFLKIKRL